jgi:hypothetical protein
MDEPGSHDMTAHPAVENVFGIAASAVGFDDFDDLAREARADVTEGRLWCGELIGLGGERQAWDREGGADEQRQAIESEEEGHSY